jgi:6-phosphogluconolactonase
MALSAPDSMEHRAVDRAALAVYVSCADDNAISIFRMARDSGALTAVGFTALGGASEPAQFSIPMAVNPDRAFLYAALRAPPYPISNFAIDAASGRLTCLGVTPPEDPIRGVKTDRTFVTLDRSGRWLLAAAPHGEKIVVNAIGPDGLVQAPATVLPSVRMIHSLWPDANNAVVYALALTADQIFRFRFDKRSGSLDPIAPLAVSPPKLGPRYMALHPAGAFFYLVTEMGATIAVFALDAGGEASCIQSLDLTPPDFVGKRQAADIRITPDGRFLYASERGTNSILGFAVDPRSGMLRPIGRTEAESVPRALALDPSGRFLLTAGTQSHRLAVFAIDFASGALARVAAAATGGNPNWIEIVELPEKTSAGRTS